MARNRTPDDGPVGLSRRRFLEVGGAVAAVGVAGCAHTGAKKDQEVGKTGAASSAPPLKIAADGKPCIRRYRTLGRTGFQVSDIGMGCGRISEANVVRYAVDHGVNFFDTAEGYSNGDSERKLGEAMPHLDRGKIFIATKLPLKPEDTEQTILDRFGKCLERLQTPYVDGFYTHGVSEVKEVANPAFHAAAQRLKADGKVRFVGLSCHGPAGDKGDSLEKVLLAAVADGRFDIMLLVYNYMNRAEGEKVLEACKEKAIATTGMKASPGVLKIDPFDPDNPSDEYAGIIKEIMGRGATREEAVTRIQKYLERAEEEMKKDRPKLEPYLQHYGILTQDELDQKSIQWVLANPAMHTICVSMPDFDKLDKILPLSGTQISHEGLALLETMGGVLSRHHCRHGCTACVSACPQRLPVSTVMRYAYYFHLQGRQKYAMGKYAALGNCASACLSCDAPCLKACPYGVHVQANLIKAHALMSLA